ncbi:MAG: thioredoxin domain-containing protein [Myxococcales bacterium]|nr:thioredoxin domain-containing protein [Myxococcales bacterium]MDH3483578.1 thioredoxin domain-containing protein [Myxococcales bacterium]
MANRLANELSPYLKQHAHNPVDWYPWGDEALERAKNEGKPIFLSVGYSACHWCHVMERESFDDPDVAQLMNELFISVKVDREERPDLDKIYQTAVQLMTRRSGGWPLTVFLTPDLKPFYGGTYFPPEDRHGMPGFPKVLRSVARTYEEQADEVESMAAEVVEALRSLDEQSGNGDVDREAALAAARQLGMRFDDRYGGLGDAPKFPNTMSLDVMLRAYRRSGDELWLSRVRQSLDAMIDGGIHDHLGGGFHRYATDARWRIPHFEKMLYDNALIGRLLVDVWRVTGDVRYRETCLRLLEYVQREMSADEGGFYATQDADSEGREGAFFVWTAAQLVEVLGPEDGSLAARYYGVDEAGNFEEGTTVLHLTRSISALARQVGATEGALASRLEGIRRKLFDARELRPKPFRDEKIITSWNGMMAGTFAEAGAAFGEPRFVARATEALASLRKTLWSPPSLSRISKDGLRQGRGFLVDYAEVSNAALDLYEASFVDEWAHWAQELAEAALDKFWDEAEGLLYFAEQSDDLVLRSEDNVDTETPSGSSSMLRALMRLDALLQTGPYREVAERVLARRAASAVANPFGYGHLIGVVDQWIHGPCHVLFVGGKSHDRELRALADAARATFVLDRMLTTAGEGEDVSQRLIGEVPTKMGAYVCRNQTCSAPIEDPAVLRRALEEV